MCDIAGFVLNERNSERYPFDLEAPLAERKRAIPVLKNAWRAANNLPVLPVAQPKAPAPVPADRLNPLLDQFLAGEADKQRAAQRDLEALGLGALPGVLTRFKATANKDERKRLDDLAKRLSTIIVAIEFADESLKPDAALSKRLETLKGKPLEPKTFMAAITATLRAMPPGAHVLQISADRDGDGAGFTLQIDLRSGKEGDAPPKGPPVSLDYHESIIARGASRGTSGQSIAAWVRDSDDDHLQDALSDALAIPPDQPIEIQLWYHGTWSK
jgi:hypothetical protein